MKRMPSYPPIFIGGTGRSGTTLLYDIMRQHPAIFAPPKEMRFLIDSGGLLNLVSALTEDYSPAQAGRAWCQIAQMMQHDLITPRTSPYRFYQLKNFMGQAYEEQVKVFLDSLLHGSFEGQVAWMEDPSTNGFYGLWGRLRHRMPMLPDLGRKVRPVNPVVRYFADREELIVRVRNFLEALFGEPMQTEGKQIWCEKTPHNKLHLDFLWELFPDALFIHMKRDPRGVAKSYVRQQWASSDLKTSCLQLADIYEAWLGRKEIIERLGNDKQVLEVKLEDFAVDPQPLLKAIAQYYDIDDRFPLPEAVDPKKVNNWQHKTNQKELQLMNDILGPYIEAMGYQI
jgi:hypothetical protein